MNRVVIDFCEECGKKVPRVDLSATGLRCTTCDPDGIATEGRAELPDYWDDDLPVDIETS